MVFKVFCVVTIPLAILTCSAIHVSLLLVTMTTPTNEPTDPIAAAPAVTPDQLPQVLSALTEDCLRDEMRTLKRELSQESREVADDRLVKRMHSEKGPAATVTDKMEEVTSLLRLTPPAVKKAKTSPPEGMTFIIARQEICGSEFVWAAVEARV